MAKAQTKTSKWRRFWGWFRRHKIFSGFCLLVLAGALYLFGSWVVLQVQIHYEREDFNKSAREVYSLANGVKLSGSSTLKYANFCTHSNFGGIFESDTIACDSEAKITYLSINESTAVGLIDTLKQELLRIGVKTYVNANNTIPDSVGSYSFTYRKIDCSLDATFSNQSAPAATRSDPSILFDIDCGGRAKQDYFPVTSD